jgi:hypothetical protein
MRITKLVYQTIDCDYEFELPADQLLNVVVSHSEHKRGLFITAIEVGVFQDSESEFAGSIKDASVFFDTVTENVFSEHARYLNYMAGNNLDIIEYAKSGEYSREVNYYIQRLSGGGMKALKWNMRLGLVEHKLGKPIDVLGDRNIELWKLSATLASVKLMREPLYILRGESIFQSLDHDSMKRFFIELMALLQQNVQVILVCRTIDLLGSPLMALKNLTVIDLDGTVESEDQYGNLG